MLPALLPDKKGEFDSSVAHESAADEFLISLIFVGKKTILLDPLTQRNFRGARKELLNPPIHINMSTLNLLTKRYSGQSAATA